MKEFSTLSTLFQPTQSLWLNVILMLIAVGVSLGVLALLFRLPPSTRRWIIVLGTFVAGLFYSIEFFWPRDNFLTDWIQPVGDAVKVIGAFTFGLGIINLCLVHGKAIARRRVGWINSAAFFTAMVAMFLVGLWKEYWPKFLSGMIEAPEGGDVMTAGQAAYEVLFNGFLTALDATMFALLAFFIVSAGYRAFRVKSGEATLMMIAAFIIMLGQVPIGMAISRGLPETGALSHFRVEQMANWLMTGINAAAQRGILFGASIGGLAMSLRIWLSLEKGAYFEQQG
jgi:hypothetical protein